MEARQWRTVGLTAVAVVGTIGIAAAVHYDTKKAMERLKEAKKQPKNFKEEAELTWKCYGRTVAAITFTTVAIILNPCLAGRDYKRLLATTGAAAGLLSKYKTTIKNELGDETYQKIVKAVNDKEIKDYEKADVPAISSQGCFENLTSPIIEGEDIFFDEFTHRTFISSPFAVLNGFYHLNRNFALGQGFVTIADLYKFWGLEPENWYSSVGYGFALMEDGIYHIDFDLVEDGMDLAGHQKWIISYTWTPGSYEEEMEGAV